MYTVRSYPGVSLKMVLAVELWWSSLVLYVWSCVYSSFLPSGFCGAGVDCGSGTVVAQSILL